ncbi:MAG: hypothetical protein ACKVOM_05710 [Ferruginibacter sp.]
MKKITFLVLVSQLIFSEIKSQDFLLMDRRWYKPAVSTDTVTKNNLSEGFYPIYVGDLDSLIIFLDRLKNLRKDGLNRKFYYSEDFKTQHLEFKIENIKRAYGDGYEINLVSNGPWGSTTLKLSDPSLLLPDNQLVIRNFLRYTKQIKKDLNKPIKKKKSNSLNNPLVN